MTVVGVTGTKGKSTAISLLDAVFSAAGKKTALLSSVHVKVGDKKYRNRTGNTMPGRWYIQSFLHRAKKAGCDIVFVEVTSQGVEQHRHRFISWDKAVFLDIHPEHIEAHGSFEAYCAVKVSFFEYVAKHNSASQLFINDEDEHANMFVEAAGSNDLILFSSQDVERLVVPQSLEGTFNKINIAAARAIARSEEIEEDVIVDAVKHFGGLEGRMEVVQQTPFLVIVDYAHTPDSLKELYEFLRTKRASENNKLICVLGSAGGGRDRWKRAIIGKIAATHCDVVILTDEDPYQEPPEQIMNEIEEGCKQVQKTSLKIHKIVDRAEAIQKAVNRAQEGDVVVATGKGSEESIHVEDGKIISWSEREVFEKALNKKDQP